MKRLQVTQPIRNRDRSTGPALWLGLITNRSGCLPLACLLLAQLFLTTSHAAATDNTGNTTDLPRVASINLCADQLLLEIADPAQILSVTNLSHDPAASIHIDKANNYPANNGIVEEILPLQPDIVLAGTFTSRYTLKLLRATGIRIEIVPISNSMNELISTIEQVSIWLQQEARANVIIETMKQQLASLPQPTKPLPRAAVYDPRGYTVGRSTLRGEMLALAGWRNVAVDKGITSYGTLPLETILKLDPDVIVKSPYSEGTWSRAQALNSHPALRLGGLKAGVINIPSSQTICGGPWSTDVIHQLLDARLALTQQVK